MKNWQTHLSDAAIRALDKGSETIGDSGERVVHRLAKEWRSLSDADKRELMEVVLAIGGAVGVAVTALRGSGKKKKKKKAKKLAKKAVDQPLKTAKKAKKK